MKRKLWKITENVVAVAALLYVGMFVGYKLGKTEQPKQAEVAQTSKPQQTVDDIDVYELWENTNAYRVEKGLQELTLDPSLNQSAKEKCDDMVKRDYWGHTTPDGKESWDIIGKYAKYNSAGENLANGQSTADEVIKDWVKSKSHRENIEVSSFDTVGFAVCHSEDFNNRGAQLIVVQHFIDKD